MKAARGQWFFWSSRTCPRLSPVARQYRSFGQLREAHTPHAPKGGGDIVAQHHESPCSVAGHLGHAAHADPFTRMLQVLMGGAL